MTAVCDCFPELKSVTEAREARYRADPDRRAPEGPQSSLEIKVTSIGNLNERVETIFMMPKDTYTFLSSRIVKEIARLGGDVSVFVPAHVAAALKRKLGVPRDRKGGG